MMRAAWRLLFALSLFLLLFPSWGQEQTETEKKEEPSSADSEKETKNASTNVVGTLQGKEGVRIQTMCTHCNSANIQVGGLNQDLVPVFRDEYPVRGGLATSFVLNMLPSDSIADSQIIKGPAAPSEPTSATGGVIKLTETRPAELPWVDLYTEGGSYDLRSGTLRTAGPVFSWLSASAVFGMQETDVVDDDGDGWNDVGAVDRKFGDARLVFTPGRDHTIDLGGSWIEDETLDGRGAFDVLTYLSELTSGDPTPSPSWTREDALVRRREIRGGWEWWLPDGSTLSVRSLESTRRQTVRSQQTRVLDSYFSAFFDRFKIKEEDKWGSARYRRVLGSKWMIHGGLEADEQEVEAQTFTAPDDPDAGSVIDFVKSRSGFAEMGWDLSARWSIQFGARYDELSWGAVDLGAEQSETEILPRAAISYNPSSSWKLKAIAGETARAPKPIFTEVCCGQNYQRSLNSRSESARSFGIEGIYQPLPEFRASAYAARAEFRDYILRMVGSSFFYIQTYVLGNIPEARADTAEIAARWSPFTFLTLDGSIGWLSFFNTGDEMVTIYVTPLFFTSPVPVDFPVDRIPYQPERTGSLSANLTLPKEIIITGQASYTGSMLIQQFNKDPFALDPDIPSILLDEMRETPGFWLANLSFQIPLMSKLELAGGINNLTDKIQNDLGDHTRDYNWGPLAGRSWHLGLRFHLDR